MKVLTTPKGTELPLLDLKGKPYLQVAHRIVWFREEHPEWLMEVSIFEKNSESVTCKAIITDENGRIRAVAHKVEHYKHFVDALEKAETGSIGRALAMLGYGTQFAPEISEEDRIVDSPIDPVKRQAPPQKPTSNLDNWAERGMAELNKSQPVPGPRSSSVPAAASFPHAQTKPVGGMKGISEKQVFRLFKIQEKANWSIAELMKYLRDNYAVGSTDEIPWNVYNDICSYIEMNPANKGEDNIPF